MSKKRRNWMKKADALFSKIVKERDGQCMACGATEFLQCAHIITRSYKAIRCHLDNAVALCRSCHVSFTHRPLEWQEWVEAQFPGRWDRLRKEALAYGRVDWKARHDELREIASNLELL